MKYLGVNVVRLKKVLTCCSYTPKIKEEDVVAFFIFAKPVLPPPLILGRGRIILLLKNMYKPHILFKKHTF